MNIRDATDADLPELLRLNDQVQKQHADQYPEKFKYPAMDQEVEEFFKGILDSDSDKVIVILKEKKLIGYLWYEIQERPENALKNGLKRFYIHHVGVDKGSRRSGAATALFKWIITKAQAASIDEIGLDTWQLNKEAQIFFEHQGFEQEKIIYSKKIKN